MKCISFIMVGKMGDKKMSKALTKKSTHDLTQSLTELTDPLTDIELNNKYMDVAYQNMIIDLRYAILDLVSGKYCQTSKRLATAYNLSYDLQLIGEKVSDFGIVQIGMLLRKEISDFAYENGIWK